MNGRVKVHKVLDPILYKRLLNERYKLQTLENDILVSTAIKIRREIPKILNSKHLTERDRIQRYSNAMRKLNMVLKQMFSRDKKKARDVKYIDQVSYLPEPENRDMEHVT